MQDKQGVPRRFLRRPEVIRRTGLQKSAIYARMKEGNFPTPASLGGRAVGWLESDIDSWIEAMVNLGRRRVA